ncbi:MAG: tyrosine-type recombinase/integrase, partial [Thermodesulfobacteriota bacterium]|nr:tyrosine-type recombinase/integrase [Thermodesulfobacteriota bacterium]
TVLTVDEVKRLLAQPNLSLSTHIRDRAIMEALYSTGIRLDELLSSVHPRKVNILKFMQKGVF